MAQSTNSTTNTNSGIIPPPPNVASFLKVADIPVSAYNGTTEFSIPLYTLQIGDLKIPISMSYYNNGLKVTEEASWIGFGWNLNVGGVIHQNIVGNPDPPVADGSRAISEAPLPIDMPAINNNDILEANRLGHGCTYTDANYNQKYFQISQLVDNGTEFTGGNNEFDLFLYNFGGYSGKFIFPNYPTTDPVLLDRNNIQFKYDGVNFTAVTPDGAQYIFSMVGTTTTPKSTCFITPLPAITSYSWYLTKIISPDGNTATFAYTEYTSNSLPTLSQSFSENQIGGIGTYLQSQGFIRDIFVEQESSSSSLNDNTTYTSSQVQNMVLSSITTANAVIKFTTSPREDVDQGTKLDNISIFRNGETAPFKGFAFNYSYFPGSALFGDWTTNANVVLGCTNQSTSGFTVPSLSERSERLKLNSMQVLGSNNVSEPPYQFIYDNSPMPFKTSLAQDLWGYFNGANNSSLLPNYNQIGYFDSTVPLNLIASDFPNRKMLANRAANPQYLQAGILKQIIYPTGGYTKVTYEPNQFTNLPGTSTQIRDTTLYVKDAGPGFQQIVFTVPDIGYQAVVNINGTPTLEDVSPATLTVNLTNPNGACSVTPGFNGYDNLPTLPSDNANGLYALLEVWDPVNQYWSHSLDNIYDFTSTAWQNPVCDSRQTVYSSSIPKLLPPGQYRITVNYPDDVQGGLPQPSASASIAYKYISTQTYTNYGGGLRVKSVAEYTNASSIYNKKSYSYSSGTLMTKPIFYRNFLDFDSEIRAKLVIGNEPLAYLGAVFANSCGGQLMPFSNSPICQVPIELAVASLSLYSNPLLNYSYSASGAPVGYSTVTVDYSTGQDIGQTVYNYTNVPDNVYYYPALLPGTPGGSYLLNGTLLSEKELKKNADGSLTTLKEEDNYWGVSNFRDYWAYKSEYVQPYGYCAGGGPPLAADGVGLFYNYLHFYPVKAGKPLLISKNETFYDSATPYSVYSTYEYNPKNQLSKVTTTKSDGRYGIQQSYYPGDYVVSTGFLSAMQSKNMIDYPIEVINNVTQANNSGGTLTSSAVYKQYYQHDNNIISPQNTYTFNSVAPVAVIPSAPANTIDSHYELRETYAYDQHGNQVTDQKVNGPVTHYLWDYQNLYPVARIENTGLNDFAYTSFEADGTGNWTFTGPATFDPTAPTGQNCYNLANGSIVNNNLNTSKTYILSYWTKNAAPFTIAGTIAGYPVQLRTLNGWYNFQHKITGVAGVSVSGSGFIDELRLYPADADMETYTYQPLIGLSGATDTKGATTYYDYDNLQNLQDVRNLNGDITKMYQYQYAGYTSGMTPVPNVDLHQTMAKNNCGSGMGGTPIVYDVPAGTYHSYVSQAAANDLAQSDINDNGQAYANANGGCAVMPCSAGTLNVVQTTGLNYSITYGASVGSGVIVQVHSSGNGVAPPQGTLSMSGGAITGAVPAAGTYTFNLLVFGVNCPNGVTSAVVSVTF
ncbi:MAG: DUF5977 domain-containing protein [Sphingobacteriales bacterium]